MLTKNYKRPNHAQKNYKPKPIQVHAMHTSITNVCSTMLLKQISRVPHHLMNKNNGVEALHLTQRIPCPQPL